jgi:ornithine cyclodeaminase/alanine dehydrogenase
MVSSLLPEAEEQLVLAREAFRMLEAGGVDAPATPELTPRTGAFAHAMPAYIGEHDLTTVKWIAGFPTNRERGLPYLSGLILVSDSDTGLPIAVMDCAAITAARTAAVSAACAARFGRPGWSRLALIGYGVQARAHIALFRRLFGGIEVVVSSRSRSGSEDGIAFSPDARTAVSGADVVVTGIPLQVRLEPPVAGDWIGDDALVLPLDDDASLDADVVNRSSRFYVDDLDDYRMRCDRGLFEGWRAPDGEVADVLFDGSGAEAGITVCANQGVGVLDALFAQAVLARAESEGIGRFLDR